MIHADMHNDAVKDFGVLALDAIYTLQVECRALTEANIRLSNQRDEMDRNLALAQMRIDELIAQRYLWLDEYGA